MPGGLPVVGMAGPLEDGATARDGPDWRPAQLEAAGFVVEFCSGGYGPNGGAKLVVAGDGAARWVRSPALALRESAVGPMLAPYADLAARIHQHAGDQSTCAVLLAARLVESALRAGSPAVPAWLDGYRLAARQARSWLAAHTEPATAQRSLASVAPADWVAAATGGLHSLADSKGGLDLDAVDVRAEPDGPTWLDGVAVDPQDDPPAGAVAGSTGVLLLAAGWTVKLRAEGVQATVRDPAALDGLAKAEEARRAAAAHHVTRLGARFVAAAGTIDDGLRGRLAALGVAVWTDAPLGGLARLARASGAAAVARLEDAAAADVGRGVLVRRRRRGWLLRGAGPSATFAVPAASEPARDAAVEQGERLLRATGLALAKPGALPGAGRWQRGLAASLRSAAAVAPGKSPIAVDAAAQAVDALADDLLRNAGGDVLAGGLPPHDAGMMDVAACVRLAVEGAFETAAAILRLDAAYAKRSSSAVGLRGGTGRAGSPRGMPGDLPPLM